MFNYSKDNDEDFESLDENSEDSHEALLKILAEVETALAAIQFIDEYEGVDGEMSEEDEARLNEWMRRRKESFNPRNYQINTEDEDNFEPPKRDEVRAMYKGIGKPAVVWKIKKNGEDIKDVIGGEYEKILYKDNIFIYANKDREVKELDPNVVINDQIIRGNFLIIQDISGKLKSLTAPVMIDIKHEMYDSRVRYVDENYNELSKEEFDER